MPNGQDGPTPWDLKYRDPSRIAEIGAAALAPKPVKSQASVQSTGEGASQIGLKQEAALVVPPPEWYAIGDDLDVIPTADGNVYVLTLDCILVKAFWERLSASANGKLYQVLLNYQNAASDEQVRKRVELLKAMLAPEDRCLITHFSRLNYGSIFWAGRWRCVTIQFSGDMIAEPYEGAVARALATYRHAISTDDWYSDSGRSAKVTFERLPSLEEEAFLDEIFSLNHIPDAPFGEGTTPPPVPAGPAPIILTDGGFSFVGDKEFWLRGVPGVPPQPIDEQELLADAPLGTAYCRTTEQSFDVIPGDLEAPAGEYGLTLKSEDGRLCFRLALDGDRLMADAAIESSSLIYLQETADGVEFLHEPSKQKLLSPPRKKLQPLEPSKKPRTPRKNLSKSNLNARPRNQFSPKAQNFDKENVNPMNINTLYTGTKKPLRYDPNTDVYVFDTTAKKIVF